MPRDKRLWMTFPIDIHRHPKIQRLPPDVRWTFVEMNGEARTARNDGVFTVEDAEYLWPPDHLDALTKSHPTRPLVIRRGDFYVIREYAEHQETVADEEARRVRNRANGAKGGRPRKNPAETDSVATGNPEQTEPKAESESESESEDSIGYVNESSHVVDVRARGLDSFSSETAKTLAAQAGVRDPAALARHIRVVLGIDVPWDMLAALVNHLASKSKGPVKAPQAYAAGCITRNPEEVKKYIYDSGLAA